jgi:hypothetical protein
MYIYHPIFPFPSQYLDNPLSLVREFILDEPGFNVDLTLQETQCLFSCGKLVASTSTQAYTCPLHLT